MNYVKKGYVSNVIYNIKKKPYDLLENQCKNKNPHPMLILKLKKFFKFGNVIFFIMKYM